MKPSNHYAQTSDGTRYGSHRLVGDRVSHQALGRSAQGRAHMLPVGNGRKAVAAATPALIAIGAGPFLSSLACHPRLERRRPAPIAGGRRAARHASRLRQLVVNSGRALSCCGPSKPSRVHSCSPKPIGETHRQCLSNASVSHDLNHDRSEGRKIGKVFQYGA